MTSSQIFSLTPSAKSRIIKASDTGFVYHIPANSPGSSSVVVSTDKESVLEAMDSMTQPERQSLLPNTVEVDYITTSDQSTKTIPDFALGRKGSQLYYGNSPLDLGDLNVRYINTAVSNTTLPSQASRWNRALASFPLKPADLLTGNGNHFLLEIDLKFEFQGQGNLSYVSGDYSGFALRLCLDEQVDSADEASTTFFNGGLAIYDINPYYADRRFVHLKVKNILRTLNSSEVTAPNDPLTYGSLNLADLATGGLTDGSLKRDVGADSGGILSTERILGYALETYHAGAGTDSVTSSNSIHVTMTPLQTNFDPNVTQVLVSGSVAFKKITPTVQ